MSSLKPAGTQYLFKPWSAPTQVAVLANAFVNIDYSQLELRMMADFERMYGKPMSNEHDLLSLAVAIGGAAPNYFVHGNEIIFKLPNTTREVRVQPNKGNVEILASIDGIDGSKIHRHLLEWRGRGKFVGANDRYVVLIVGLTRISKLRDAAFIAIELAKFIEEKAKQP